ncbi:MULTISPECIES: FecR family protein [unclassified Pseudomonas]|uniref:FecR family protein n=1 Tax=unclassified Pseudomonas TaxID=196821 RepID=UPI0021C7E534|nr:MULTISPECIES: FecR domain-containing protein [unclassified Pseudomonas]MCU1721717.1 FecR domain-containing protein [Pseudomonas sp. 5P_5.1_Bac1]MCU1730926.1 FecR domain-containing protein [Pseudomonas sp. 20P_3.2_Bac4]MCU1747711.1 FecR domain-containing protein [Pseudomonas sp. 20P_3.2_Bac5]
MTDHPSHSPSPPDPAACDRAMGEALDWLIRLQCASAEDTQAFEAWLEADPANAPAYVEAEALWNGNTLRQAAGQLHEKRKPSPLARLRPHWKPLATAAVLLVGVFTVGNLPVRLQADHLTVVGERQRVQLDDGSRVLLNTNSAFSSDIDTRQRVARLYQGEAFFEVTAGRTQPLELQAGPLRASVRDSDFAVRYLNGEAQVRVQRGDVDLLASSDQRIRLSSGDSIRVGPNGFSQRERADLQKDLAWVEGRLIFENCPLSQVLAELRRYYPGWIISTNGALDQVAVTGNYRLDQPLEAVRSLAHITSAQVREFPAVVILN